MVTKMRVILLTKTQHFRHLYAKKIIYSKKSMNNLVIWK